MGVEVLPRETSGVILNYLSASDEAELMFVWADEMAAEANVMTLRSICGSWVPLNLRLWRCSGGDEDVVKCQSCHGKRFEALWSKWVELKVPLWWIFVFFLKRIVVWHWVWFQEDFCWRFCKVLPDCWWCIWSSKTKWLHFFWLLNPNKDKN